MVIRLLLTLIGCFCVLSPLRAESLEVYQTQAKDFMSHLLELSDLSRKMAGASQDLIAEKNGKIKRVSQQIDFLTLSQASLGPRWKKISDKEKQEFLKTLQELLEEVVFPLAKKIAVSSDKMEFKNIPKQANWVKVEAKIEREKRGELVSQDLEVDLIFSKSKPTRIVDAVIEGERLSENLKRQFDEALKKKSFGQIIERMKSRVEEARSAAREKKG